MSINSTKSASRYAKALLELAIEQNKIDKVSSDMRAIVAAKNETNEFQLFLNSPLIQSDKKISILNQCANVVILIVNCKLNEAIIRNFKIKDSFL
jgi:F0F1-type ATP synthase delta subunit